jgi:SAM-dependent methyltransferase
MSKFDPGSYLRSRVEYPVALFSPLSTFVGTQAGSLRVLDLGAGTGLSARSFLRFFPEVDSLLLVDPDPAMLAVAEASFAGSGFPEVGTLVSGGENLGTPDPVDLVLVGSAWHWMNTRSTIEAIRRVLRPGGCLFVFEYQFPKAKGVEGAGLNEWIRRAFNRDWKESDQSPRGSLKELVSGFHAHPDFAFRGESRVEQDAEMGVEDLFGVIVSQSRYLAFERRLDGPGVDRQRQGLLEDLRQNWGERPMLAFSYRFHGIRFQVRNV